MISFQALILVSIKMADCQSVATRKRKIRISSVKNGVYPSPSLGCFLAYITINAVLVCLEWDVKDW